MAKKYSVEWWHGLRPERIGAETESLVRVILDKMNTRQDFTYHRMPDAKAARGALPAQPGDFLYASNDSTLVTPYVGFLEVKACKHPYRLAKDKISQLAKLNLFEMAGAKSYVLVNHYLQGYWRVVPTSWLADGAPSWDLSGCPMYSSPVEALHSVPHFKRVIEAVGLVA